MPPPRADKNRRFQTESPVFALVYRIFPKITKHSGPYGSQTHYFRVFNRNSWVLLRFPPFYANKEKLHFWFFSPSPLMPRRHRDARSFVYVLVPQRPLEVSGQAQNFRSSFKFCLSKFCRNAGVHQRRGHRDTLSLIRVLVPQCPLEVSGKPKTSVVNFTAVYENSVVTAG